MVNVTDWYAGGQCPPYGISRVLAIVQCLFQCHSSYGRDVPAERLEQRQAPEETIAKHYRILAPLAQGGNGITYLGDDLDTGERVVLKALSLRQIHDWKALERFEREAQVLAQLNHPGIPRYLDYFYQDTPSHLCVIPKSDVIPNTHFNSPQNLNVINPYLGSCAKNLFLNRLNL